MTLVFTASLSLAAVGLAGCSEAHAPRANGEPGTDNGGLSDGGAADSGSMSGSGGSDSGDGLGGAGGEGAGSGAVAGSSGSGGCSSSATCTSPQVCDLRSQVCAALTVLTVEVTPTDPTITRTTAQHFSASVTYNDGATADVTAKVTWASSDVSVGTLDANGLATGVSAGQSTISATFSGTTGSTLLTVSDATVSPPQVTSIVIEPVDATIAKGTSQQFTAEALFDNGTSRDVTDEVTWASSEQAVATISNTSPATRGLAAGGGEGSTTISAVLNDVSGTSTLTVTSASLQSISIDPINSAIVRGTTQQFIATGNFSDGSTANITTQVAWSSSNLTVASISTAGGSEGLASSIGVGSTTIGAGFLGVTAQTQLTINASSLVSISVSPVNPSIAVATQQPFTAIGMFDNGTTQDITSLVNWASSNMQVATVSNVAGSPGLATGLRAGQSSISANFQGKTGQTTLTIAAITLRSITIAPSNASIGRRAKQQFTATGTFTDGSMRDLTNQITWSSSNPQVAVISNALASRGLATGRAQGTTTIGAALNGVSASTTLTVNTVTLTSIAVSPATASIARQQTTQFTAVATFSDSSTQDLTAQVVWSSSKPSVATISKRSGSRGRATGVAAGSTTIKASWRMTSGTATLTVTRQ